MYCTKLSWENIDNLVVNVLNNNNNNCEHGWCISRVAHNICRPSTSNINYRPIFIYELFHITSNINHFRTGEYKHVRIKSIP